MRVIGRILVLLVLTVTLVACGGSSGKPKDRTAPTITLTGDNPQVIEAGTAYAELGATANDNRDGDLSGSIAIDASQVDTSVPGSYVVTYTVTDGAGNSGAANRTVVVEDTTPPVITLLGDDLQIIVAPNPYVELGATASDTLDGDLSANIVVDATALNTMVAGEYTVTYDVTDAAGNAALTVARTVRVELPPLPAAPQVSVEGDSKQLIFSWEDIADADLYKLMENPDGHSGFTQVGDDVPIGTTSAARDISVHLHDWVNALYVVQACNLAGCTGSAEIASIDVMLDTIGYFKASNTDSGDGFGGAVALSADGKTLAWGAPNEDSNATGINGDQTDNSAVRSGAVYLFRFDGIDWTQQTYIKASDTAAGDTFGGAVALSADGNLLAVGARGAEAAYLFRFDGNEWIQQAEIKASNAGGFGGSVTLSADGKTLAVGASSAGVAHLFRFDGVDWVEQAHIQPSDTDADIAFGSALVLSGDGNTLAVGATLKDWPLFAFGTVYLFRFDGMDWTQQANLSALASYWDLVGSAIALSADGDRLAVGVANKDRIPPGKDCSQEDCSDEDSGAVYLLAWDGSDWNQQAYITASNPDVYDGFGGSVALSADGNMLAVGTGGEDSSATGVNGDQTDNSASFAGAVYMFRFDGMDWKQESYVKASNTDSGDGFGGAVALSADGKTLAVGAFGEDSSTIGINGDQADNSADDSGAVYVY